MFSSRGRGADHAPAHSGLTKHVDALFQVRSRSGCGHGPLREFRRSGGGGRARPGGCAAQSEDRGLARRLTGPERKQEKQVPASQLRKGDVVVVEANQIIPGDGTVIEALPRSMSRPLPANRHPSSAKQAATVRPSPAARWCCRTASSSRSPRNRGRRSRPEIRLVEGRSDRRRQRDRPRHPAAGLTIVFLFATVTLKPFAIYSGSDVSVTILVALLVCLIPRRSARCCRPSASPA